MAVFKEGEDIIECITQYGSMPIFGQFPQKEDQSSPDGTNPIMVGYGKMVPRWDTQNIATKPLVLRYFLDYRTFRNIIEGISIQLYLAKAADLWNDVGCGVKFEATEDPANAHFAVVYSWEGKPTAAARAFFPNDPRQLEIYAAAFDDEQTRVQMQNSITHEFGHILGLRHEHAWEKERGAVLIGEWNDDSIMGYNRATRKLQESDKDGLRELYRLPVGTKIEGCPIKDFKARAMKGYI